MAKKKNTLLKNITLYDYQRVAVDQLHDLVAKGHKRLLLVAPTGSGKTIMYSEFAAERHAQGDKVLVVAHRKELVEQGERKLKDSGIEKVAVFHGTKKTMDDTATVCVASIQSIKPGLIDADVVVVDEAHHALADSYMALLDMYPNAIFVGPTATPWHGSGKGLGKFFKKFVVASTVKELITRKFLTDTRIFTHESALELDLSNVKIQGSTEDYDSVELSEKVNKPKLIGDIVKHWQQYASGRPTLAFAASIAHSKQIVAAFNKAGVRAEHIDGKSTKDEREGALIRLRLGITLVVSNYGVLTEGFDEPLVSCVILARPTLRPGVYMQCVGRGMRKAPGKKDCIVLDHAGSCVTFGLPEMERPFSLSDLVEPKRPKIGPLVRRCPSCGITVPIGTKECPECTEVLRKSILVVDPKGKLIEYNKTRFQKGVGPEHKKYTYKGKTQTLAEWGVELNIPLKTLVFRAKKNGATPKGTLFLPVNYADPTSMVEYEGKMWNKKDLAKKFGVPPTTFNNRLYSGMSLEEALKKPKVVPPKKLYNGEYLFQKDIAKATGVSKSTISRRMKANSPLDLAGKPKAETRQVSYKGKTYRTTQELADELNIGAGVLRHLLSKPDAESAIASYKEKSVVYEGVRYNSLTAMGNALGLTSTSLRNKAKHMPLPEAVKAVREGMRK